MELLSQSLTRSLAIERIIHWMRHKTLTENFAATYHRNRKVYTSNFEIIDFKWGSGRELAKWCVCVCWIPMRRSRVRIQMLTLDFFFFPRRFLQLTDSGWSVIAVTKEWRLKNKLRAQILSSWESVFLWWYLRRLRSKVYFADG